MREIAPFCGVQGDIVTIRGSGFKSGIRHRLGVKVGGMECDVVEVKDEEIKIKIPPFEHVPGVNKYGVWDESYEVCHTVRYKDVAVCMEFEGGVRGGCEGGVVFEYEFEDMKGRWDLMERKKKKRKEEFERKKNNGLGLFKVVPKKRFYSVDCENLDGFKFEMGEKYLTVVKGGVEGVRKVRGGKERGTIYYCSTKTNNLPLIASLLISPYILFLFAIRFARHRTTGSSWWDPGTPRGAGRTSSGVYSRVR